MKRKYIVLFCAAVFLLALVLILTGSSILSEPLDAEGKVPAGTFITWFGLIALSILVYLGGLRLRNPITNLDQFFSVLSKIFIVLALLWAPVSALIAGNWSFSFTGVLSFQGGHYGMRTFWIYTFTIAVGPILNLLLSCIIILFKKS